MNFARLSTLYWTQSLSNLESDGSTIDADLDQTFSKNLLDKANDWIVAVERFELSLNGIPYYNGKTHNEYLSVWNRTTDAEDSFILLDFDSFSLHDTIKKLNEYFGVNNTAVTNNWEIQVDGEGFVTFSTSNTNYFPKFPQKLNYILGLVDDNDYSKSDTINWTSEHPRWGLGDELDHITIKSNLNLVSDTIGEEKTNIVTDLSIPAGLSASSGGGYSYSARDKLIYTPSERRYLNFNSTAPVQVIRLFVEYQTPDKTRRIVRLPHGGVFNVKLAFFHRI